MQTFLDSKETTPSIDKSFSTEVNQEHTIYTKIIYFSHFVGNWPDIFYYTRPNFPQFYWSIQSPKKLNELKSQ